MQFSEKKEELIKYSILALAFIVIAYFIIANLVVKKNSNEEINDNPVPVSQEKSPNQVQPTTMENLPIYAESENDKSKRQAREEAELVKERQTQTTEPADNHTSD